MEELPIVALGCLLHDIGKVVQRADENPMKQSHSKFGFAILENAGLVESNQKWQWVLESVRYHHWKDIKEGNASLPIAWFAFEADNLASAHDRRNAKALFDKDDNRLEETASECTAKWDPKRRLDSIFANFKRRNESVYATKLPLWFRRTKELRFTRDLYPYPELVDTQGDVLQNYQILRDKVLSPLVHFLKTASPDSVDTVNATLHYLEENLSMVPPDTFAEHTNDVSLFDHLKLTAAIGSCMYAYVHEKHSDWLTKPGKQIPWDRGFRKEPAYLLVKADMSGIQDFIYNVSSKSALKSLRGRSFFLELLQSHLSDHILGELNLSRANLLYQGGGGFVLLLPNTQKAVESLEAIKNRFNDWLFENHKGRLFLALEWVPATGEQLRAGDSGSQSMVSAWREITKKIGQSKSEKFKTCLVKLFEVTPHIEECLICHRDDQKLVQSLNSDQRDSCYSCSQLIILGKNLPDADFKENGKQSSELKISTSKDNLGLLPNLGGDSSSGLSVSIASGGGDAKDSFVLHNMDLFKPPKLFWSLYEHGDNEFIEFARAAEGVERIAVLRADVDNLGKIFSGQDKSIGLPDELRSISRDAAVSRALARFFSHYLDDLLRSKRNELGDKWFITTVYAGGDDVFLVGAWSQIVDFALLLQQKFEQYTCGRLTLSAGIAIQKPKYPFYRLSQEAQDAEHEAKLSAGKNSLCVRFDERFADGSGSGSHNYSWSEWSNTIKPLVETMKKLSADNNISRGFWNDLLVFTRSKEMSFYRLLYSIARAEEANGRLLKSDDWLSFKKDWLITLGGEASASKKARLETALNWLILLTRDGGQTRNGRDEREVAAGVR